MSSVRVCIKETFTILLLGMLLAPTESIESFKSSPSKNKKRNPMKTDYCVLNCNNSLHVACPQPCFSNSCTQMPQSYQFRMAMLQVHNKIRSDVALGYFKNYTSGANMMALSYDIELEFFAYCWAAKKMSRNNSCAATFEYPEVGQNIATVPENTANRTELQRLVYYYWVNDFYKAAMDVVDKFRYPNGSVQYDVFTQVIAARTVKMGCGRCKMKRKFTYINCYYAPRGNVVGQPVYMIGKPATRCPDNTSANSRYPSLCGEIVVPPETRYAMVEGAVLVSHSKFLICPYAIMQIFVYINKVVT